MIKLFNDIVLHISIVREMLTYFFKQKQLVLIPGLLLWSLLPLSLILILFGLFVMFKGLITAFI